MKKSLVALTAVLTMGICCSSALASDIDASLKVGYNLAKSSSKMVTVSGSGSIISEDFTATGGGGISITAAINADIQKGFGIKGSVTGDYMSKAFKTNKTSSKGIEINTNLVESFKKWTLSGDALVTYNFVNNVPGLKAGIQGGVNFVSTNVADALIEDGDFVSVADYYTENGKASGGALVVGAFADYKINDKLNVSADGYIGLLKFGSLINPLSNYKVNAELSYEVMDNLNIVGGFTFANNVLSTEITNTAVGDTTIYRTNVDYTYTQLTPSIGVNYNF